VEAIHPEVSIVSSVHEGGKYHFPHDVTQAALREAIDPISSKPQGQHKPDPDLRILYTSSRKVDGENNDSDMGPLGTIGVLLGPGGNRREIWRFGDEPAEDVKLGDGRPMKRTA
jgi:hypothetical protein